MALLLRLARHQLVFGFLRADADAIHFSLWKVWRFFLRHLSVRFSCTAIRNSSSLSPHRFLWEYVAGFCHYFCFGRLFLVSYRKARFGFQATQPTYFEYSLQCRHFMANIFFYYQKQERADSDPHKKRGNGLVPLCNHTVAASAVAASFWRIQSFTPNSQQPSSLTFFSPDGYTDELAQRTHLGMVNIYSIDGLRKDLETARKNNSQLQIDFSPIFSQQRPAEHLNQYYVHEGKSYKKSFEPRPLNKVRDLPNKDQLAELLKLFIPLLKEHTQQIAAVFLIDEPYMHGISKAEMSRLAQDVRDLLEENGLQQLPLGITFSAAMFDARFAQLVDQQASQWVHDVEQYYQRLNQSTLQEDREQLTQWLDVFKEQRLTTYDLANNYYTGGGIPEGYDIIAYNLYTATLLQDAVHRKTLAWFAEQGLSRACNRFHNLDISQIRSQLSFYKDGPVEPDGLKQDRDLLNDIFLCKSESILALLKAQAPSRPYRLQLFGESSANGFLEFDSQGNIEKGQPDLLVAARVHEEVERTLRFYDRHQKDFEAGVMFFIWDDTVDGSINLHISGARSMPSVTQLVFERIGK